MKDLSIEDQDYYNGRIAEQGNEVANAQANVSAVSASGVTTQVLGFNASGQPIAINVTGDSNGAGLSANGVTLQATLPQDLKTTAAVEFASIKLSTSGAVLVDILSATASLNFGNTAAQTSADLTITVTGAQIGDTVALGVPNGSVNADSCFTAWVSAADTVTVRFNNYSAGAIDPASGTFRATVFRF